MHVCSFHSLSLLSLSLSLQILIISSYLHLVVYAAPGIYSNRVHEWKVRMKIEYDREKPSSEERK